MKIAVIGAGAVGGYFGARLLEIGCDVTFLVREKRAEQLQRTGLVLKSAHGDAQFADVRTETDPQRLTACDLAVLCVKNYHLDGVMELLKPLVEKGAKVLPMLNGIEHLQKLTAAFGQEAVLGGLAQIIATLGARGEIVQIGPNHEFAFGPLVPSQGAFCLRLAEMLAPANMKTVLRDDIYTAMWEKYTFITAFSGVTTASRLTIDRIMAIESAKNVFRRTLEEMASLARAKDAPLAPDFPEQTVARMARLVPGSTSSMHKDFQKGLPLEVESVQGGALRIAAEAGLELPTVAALYGLIKPYEHGPVAG